MAWTQYKRTIDYFSDSHIIISIKIVCIRNSYVLDEGWNLRIIWLGRYTAASIYWGNE
jgi:hypothetical protein